MTKLIKLNHILFKNDIKALTLAVNIGMSTTFLSQCIRGRRSVPERYKKKILQYLQKKVDPKLEEKDIF